MTSLMGWMLKRWSWKSFAVGAGAIIVGGTVGRPALVAAVKTGMEVADAGVLTYNQAKTQVIAIHNDAAKLRSAETDAQSGGLHEVLASIQAELQNLRQDVAANRNVAKKSVA
jgi:protein involved in polysaccharide export with SLBB domain